MLCPAFAAVLKSARNDFNAQFRQAQLLYPALDAAVFSSFLRDAADPLVGAVAAVQPDATFETARVAYASALTLVGRQLAGSHARDQWIIRLWRKALCAAAPLVANDPQRLINAASNAVLNLAATPNARTADWIAGLQALAPRTDTVDTLLTLGQLLAWRCGMAHFREPVLAASAGLPVALALAAVGASDKLDWRTERLRFCQNPWYAPGQAIPLQGFVVQTGGFRGFGGLFATPPFVGVSENRIVVQSGNESWQLHADAFGATFSRLPTPDGHALPKSPVELPAGIALPAWLGNPTSVAVTTNTVAVTGTTTHSVLLFARAI